MDVDGQVVGAGSAALLPVPETEREGGAATTTTVEEDVDVMRSKDAEIAVGCWSCVASSLVRVDRRCWLLVVVQGVLMSANAD